VEKPSEIHAGPFLAYLFFRSGIVGRVDVVELHRDMPWIWITVSPEAEA